MRREWLLGRQQVAQLLLDEVADHAFRLGAEDVERVRLDLLVGRALERQEADLWTVAVGDHQLVVRGEGSQLLRGHAHVLPLVLGGHGLPATEQRIAAQGDDDPHRLDPLSRRWWRRGPP